ncbi:hypothetical protein BFP76_12820 [Amylibacter kogurei]|uniref:Uncharacterized protein n=1 Tax=Paramylibacter kogurei TaxID=1889778 RepID=A0A2G5K9P1_9RHOB|nr:hypothetical protein [Amylibacter kogurei]PIB25879.1 hypothetical protein BFP76_12820 [Amylibacter kogurei]
MLDKMKTAYVIKSAAKDVSFDCDRVKGLTFITSVIDVTYLNNAILGCNLKLLVQQKIDDDRIEKPIIWFLIFSAEPISNTNLEKAWRYAIKVGATLNQYTQLGHSFSYENFWGISGIPDEWNLAETQIKFSDNQEFEGIYWYDPKKPTKIENGEEFAEVEIRHRQREVRFTTVSPEGLTYNHFAHASIPGKVNVGSKFSQRKNVLEKLGKKGFSLKCETSYYLLSLYNRAITSHDVFHSNNTLFQMVEVIIGSVDGTKISPEAKSKLAALIDSDPDLHPFSDRIVNAIGGIPIETSKELLKSGLIKLVGKEAAENLDFSDFGKWRKLRGALTHPKKAQALTDVEFVATYNSLRNFCTALTKCVNEL